MPVDRFCNGRAAVCDDNLATRPGKHFEKGGFTADFSRFCMNHLSAREINAPAFSSALDLHRAGGHHAAFHLDQIGERGAARGSGEGVGLISGCRLHGV